jgi:hypothetical protein
VKKVFLPTSRVSQSTAIPRYKSSWLTPLFCHGAKPAMENQVTITNICKPPKADMPSAGMNAVVFFKLFVLARNSTVNIEQAKMLSLEFSLKT